MKWKWTVKHQEAFEKIKIAFQHCVLLQHPDTTRPYILRCDASKLVIAAILSQINEFGEDVIIEVTSRCLTETESKYSITEMELLSIVNALRKWRHYVLGSVLTVKTDHQALCCLRKARNLSARMTRGIQFNH